MKVMFNLVMVAIASSLSFRHVNSNSKKITMSTVDPTELSKINKYSLYKLLLKSEDEYRRIEKDKNDIISNLSMENVRIAKENVRIEKDKNEIITSLKEIYGMKLIDANTKYLKARGSLDLRGLIEAFENLEEFKVIKKTLNGRINIWNEVEKKLINGNCSAYIKDLVICLSSTEKRYESLGVRISNLYNTLSRSIHKPDIEDTIVIRKSQFFPQEVELAICLCKAFPVQYDLYEDYAYKPVETTTDTD